MYRCRFIALNKTTLPLYVILSTLFIHLDAAGQAIGSWEVVNEKLESYTLESSTTLSDGSIVAVGERGVVRVSRDGGKSWSSPPRATWETLNGVRFVDSRIGVAIGNGAAIVRTTDGGENWSVVSTLVDSDFLGVAWSDSAVVVVGTRGVALRSTDLGLSWTATEIPSADSIISIASRPSGVMCVGSATGGVFVTTDHGANWESLYSIAPSRVRNISMPTDTHWYLASIDKGSYYRTEDASKSWEMSGQDTIVWMSFLAADTGVRITLHYAYKPSLGLRSYTTLELTVDQGKSWLPINGYDGGYGRAVDLNSDNEIVMVGYQGLITRYSLERDFSSVSSSDVLSPSISYRWEGVDCADEDNCVVVGYSIRATGGTQFSSLIDRTTDAGLTWKTLNHPFENTFSEALDVHCFDSLNFVVVGEDGMYLATSDGGSTWNREVLSLESKELDRYRSIHFDEEGRGVLLNGGASMGVSDDFGNTWRLLDSIDQWGVSIAYRPTPSVIFCSAGWDFLVSSDTGSTFQRRDSRGFLPSGISLGEVVFTSPENGWIASAYPSNIAGRSRTLLLRTTGNLLDWESVIDEDLDVMRRGAQSIAFADAMHGVVGGTGRGFLHTTDGGETWFPNAIDERFTSTGVFGAQAISYPTKSMALAVDRPHGIILKYSADASSVANVVRSDFLPVWLWAIVPNPASGVVDLSVSWIFPIVVGDVSLEIYDQGGVLLVDITDDMRKYANASGSPVKFNTNTLASGIYYVVARGKHYMKTRSLVVVH